MGICDYHTELVANIAVIKTDIQYIKDRVCNHIKEGEEKGGFRDRLIILEQEVSVLKKVMWMRVIVAGFVGGLIADGTPELIKWFLNLIK